MKLPKSKFKKFLFYKILLYYSTIFSTILIVGGFWTARLEKEIISNLLFLPIVVFLWITLIKYRREIKLIKLETKILTKETKNPKM